MEYLEYLQQGDKLFYFLTASALLKYWSFRNWSEKKPKHAKLVGKVTALRLHPVKSMKGFLVDELNCTFDAPKYGDVSDRQWMVTFNQDGQQIALMAKIEPRMFLIKTNVRNNKTLILSAPGMSDLEIDVIGSGPVVDTKVYGQPVKGIDCGDKPAEWIKTFLNKPQYSSVRVLQYVKSLKKANILYGPERLKNPVKPNDKIIYQDAGPLYMITEASTGDVNDRLKRKLTLDDLRPNLVVGESSPAFQEDFWEEIYIGEAKFTNYLPCDRCSKTLVNQDTGVPHRDGEPLATMRKYRQLTPEFKGFACFGRFLVVDRPGTIKVGDPVYATIVDKYIG